MADVATSNGLTSQQVAEKTPFEKQRDGLIGQITQSMEQIITNMNLLNRSIEGVIAVGKEFESVSTLWRSFHEVLAKGEEVPVDGDVGEQE